jgi:hypothetical protein
MLMERNPSVSVFAVLTVCAHPVIEVLFSICRRKIKKRNPGLPDRLHFHSLLHQRYVRRRIPGQLNTIHNSLAGIMVGSMTITAIVTANLFMRSVWLSAAGFLVLTLGYVTIYARMIKYRWCSPIKFLLIKPFAKISPRV